MIRCSPAAAPRTATTTTPAMSLHLIGSPYTHSGAAALEACQRALAAEQRAPAAADVQAHLGGEVLRGGSLEVAPLRRDRDRQRVRRACRSPCPRARSCGAPCALADASRGSRRRRASDAAAARPGRPRRRRGRRARSTAPAGGRRRRGRRRTRRRRRRARSRAPGPTTTRAESRRGPSSSRRRRRRRRGRARGRRSLAVPVTRPPSRCGCQYWLSAGIDCAAPMPPNAPRGQCTASSKRTSMRASGPRSTCRLDASARTLVWPSSPAHTPRPWRSPDAFATATEREKPPGWPATPTVPHVAPSRSRLIPASTMSDRARRDVRQAPEVPLHRDAVVAAGVGERQVGSGSSVEGEHRCRVHRRKRERDLPNCAAHERTDQSR